MKKLYPFFISISISLGLSILVISIRSMIKSLIVFKNPFSNDFWHSYSENFQIFSLLFFIIWLAGIVILTIIQLRIKKLSEF